jgi:hypothetical protein
MDLCLALLKELQSNSLSWAWWFMPVIPVLERLRQDAGEFEPAWATWETLSQKKISDVLIFSFLAMLK